VVTRRAAFASFGQMRLRCNSISVRGGRLRGSSRTKSITMPCWRWPNLCRRSSVALSERLATLGRRPSQLAKNLSILSTSAPARCARVELSVSRRGTCDRRIWTKPLAFAADAEGYINIKVWGFNGRFAISSPSGHADCQFCQNVSSCTDAYYHLQSRSCIVPHKLPILEHAVASAAPAASSKSL